MTAYLWPIVREIIKTTIENRQNLIVEGCYIPFDWKKDFEEEHLNYMCDAPVIRIIIFLEAPLCGHHSFCFFQNRPFENGTDSERKYRAYATERGY